MDTVASRKRRRSEGSSSPPDRQSKHIRHGAESPLAAVSDSGSPPGLPPPQPSSAPSVHGLSPSAAQLVASPDPNGPDLSTAPIEPPSSERPTLDPPESAETPYPPPYSYTVPVWNLPSKPLKSLWMRVWEEFGLVKGTAEGNERLAICLRAILTPRPDLLPKPNVFFVDQSLPRLLRILKHDEGLANEVKQYITLTAAYEQEESLDLFLSILYHGYRPENTFKGMEDIVEDEQVTRLVRTAWDTPLRGATDIKLVKSLQKCFNAGPAESKDYSNTVAILNSSGTGKTRSAYECGKYIFPMPFCLRPKGHPSEYPRADASIRDLMCAVYGNFTPELIVANRFRQILRVYAGFATQFLRRQKWTETTQPRAFWEKTNAWNLYLESNRQLLYDTIASRVSSLENSYTAEQIAAAGGSASTQNASHAWLDSRSLRARQALNTLRHELEHIAVKDVLNFDEDELLPPELDVTLSADAMRKVRVTVKELVNRWELVTKSDISAFWTGSKEPRLLLMAYFDEAHVLFTPTTSEAPKSQYDHLLHVFNDMLASIFGVFLSTSSYLRQFAPPAALSASERQAKSDHLQPPITEVPFDCMPNKIVLADTKLEHREHLKSVTFLAQFGRPLFWTILNAQQVEDVDRRFREGYVLNLAQGKLAGKELVNMLVLTVNEYPKNAAIAVLDLRLAFDYETRMYLANHMEADLVAMHMRLVYTVLKDRLYLFSGYSSEPLLAEAAARLMRAWMWDWSSSAAGAWNPLAELAKLMKSNLLDRGERGELVGRWLLVHAYDLAMLSINGNDHRGWMFSAGCPVDAFIKALFREPTAKKVLRSLPDNIAATSEPKTFTEAFGTAYVRFTHFVRLLDGSGLTTVGLAAAFVRGMAFICKVGQALIDFIIPILLDYTKPVTPDNMSAILVQVKRRIKAGTTAQYDFTAEDLRLFDDSDPVPKLPTDDLAEALLDRPYMTLLLELGVRPMMTPSSTEPPAAPVTAPKNKGKGKAAAKPKSPPKPKATAAVKAPAKPKAAARSKATATPQQAPAAAGPSGSTRSKVKAHTTEPDAPGDNAPGPSTSTAERPKRGRKPAKGDEDPASTAKVGAAPQRRSPRTLKPHPRYSLRVYGCSPRIYNVIKPEDQSLVDGILLAKYTMFEEHPRQERIEDVWQMKPYWVGPDSYHWSTTVPVVDNRPDPRALKGYVKINNYDGPADENNGNDEDVEMDM